MQDTRTGELIPLTPEQADREAKRRDRIDQMFGELHKADSPTLAAYGETMPPVADRGPIFAIGEIVEIKGGRFRIQRFNGNKLVLKSLPRL